MSHEHFFTDDPRLTAYALGELSPEEAREIERQLADSLAAQAAVREIRELAGVLQAGLQSESALALREEQRAAILVAAAGAPVDASRSPDFLSGRNQNAMPAQSANASARIENPGYGREAASSSRRRWAGWLASLATVAAVVLVAVLVVSTTENVARAPRVHEQSLLVGQTENREVLSDSYWNEERFGKVPILDTPAGESRLSFGVSVQSAPKSGEGSGFNTSNAAVVRSAEQGASSGADSPSYEIFDNRRFQFRSDIGDSIGGVATTTPASPVATPAEQRLGEEAQSGSDPNRIVPFYVGVAESTGKLGKRSSTLRAGRGETTESEAVPRDEKIRLGRFGSFQPEAGKSVGQAAPENFGTSVQSFNQLMTQGRYRDAESVAKKVQELNPSNPVAEVMILKSKLARQEGAHQALREQKAASFTETLNDIDVAAVNYTDSIKYGDVRKWQDLTTRRKQLSRVDKSSPTEVDLRVEKNLSREVSLHFENAPLSEIVEHLAQLGEVNIVLNRKSIESAPVNLNTPVTINVDGIRLKSVLNLALEPLGFAYAVKDGAVVIGDRMSLSQDATAAEQGAENAARNATLLRAIDQTVADIDELAKARSQAFLGLARADELKQQELQVRRQLEELRRMRNQAPNTEAYTPITENHFVAPLSEPLSTFGVDVDTASYSNMRRFLNEGQLPPPDAVRVEELVNYFRYETPAAPVDGRPFAVAVEVGAAPWQPAHRLVRIGLKGREIAADKRPASNLVFLVDVSGSMQSDNKLPLAKTGLKLLAGQMTENDRVAIVTYSNTATLRLASTNGTNRQAILETIDSLQAGGSTNGAGGIQLAYGTAIENFIDGGINRVILLTDGDFNVGVTGDDELVKMIEERARTKIFFSVFGFGMGNLKDGKLEKLADKGNGHYAYIDGPREAKKVFVDELAGTLVTIAKDVKVQVEFNPARVAAYRLIGYENRALAAQDFDDDRKDAGDIGAGHSVTALYEVVPAPEAPPAQAAEGLRYQRGGLTAAGDVAKELLAVKLRYKQPEADVSSLIEVPVADIQSAVATNPTGNEPASLRQRPSRDFEWSAAVAAFGMVLRDSTYRGQAGFDLVLELAQGAKGADPTGQRREFIELVERAKLLRPDLSTTAPTTSPSPGAASPASANRNERDIFKNLNSQQIEELLGGRYKNLLRIIPAESDAEENGNLRDYGYWDGTSYLGHNNLPKGYWVYVYPNWYIWGDAAEGAAPVPAKPPTSTKPR